MMLMVYSDSKEKTIAKYYLHHWTWKRGQERLDFGITDQAAGAPVKPRPARLLHLPARMSATFPVQAPVTTLQWGAGASSLQISQTQRFVQTKTTNPGTHG